MEGLFRAYTLSATRPSLCVWSCCWNTMGCSFHLAHGLGWNWHRRRRSVCPPRTPTEGGRQRGREGRERGLVWWEMGALVSVNAHSPQPWLFLWWGLPSFCCRCSPATGELKGRSPHLSLPSASLFMELCVWDLREKKKTFLWKCLNTRKRVKKKRKEAKRREKKRKSHCLTPTTSAYHWFPLCYPGEFVGVEQFLDGGF